MSIKGLSHSEVAVCILIQLFLFGCSKDSVIPNSDQDPLQSRFIVEFYDVTLKVDPGELIFQSEQAIKIKATQILEEFEFELHADLVIDEIILTALQAAQLPIGWEHRGDYKYSRGTEEEIFSRYAVTVGDVIQSGEALTMGISYHIKPTAIISGASNELLKFAFSESGSRALHPVSGVFPYFGGLIAAPFRFALLHPGGQYSSVPGNLVESGSEGKYLLNVYESGIPLIPVFYVNSCEKVVRNQDGISVEFLLASGQTLPDAVVDHTFEIARLYNHNFGDPGTATYRFAYIDVPFSSTTGESKGNAIYFARLSGDNVIWDDEAIVNFVQLVGHELFHNWNIWSVHWQGKLYEWFVEGGAGFMSAWTCQNILGEEAGRTVRNGFIEGYLDHKGYTSSRTLENAQKQGAAEVSLIYSYGALVWEQLRRNLGDEIFFSGLGDFFTGHQNAEASSEDLIAALEARAGYAVEPYLDQWVKHNAQIDLSISDVTIQSEFGKFTVNVQLLVESNLDYQVYTQIGYLFSINSEMQLIDVNIEHRGLRGISFTSDERPVLIRIDPDRCVPQVDLDNDSWEK